MKAEAISTTKKTYSVAQPKTNVRISSLGGQRRAQPDGPPDAHAGDRAEDDRQQDEEPGMAVEVVEVGRGRPCDRRGRVSTARNSPPPTA